MSTTTVPIKTKDPQAVLDYGFDWAHIDSAWLVDGDTIAASSWASSGAGLSIDANTFDDTHTTVWLSGGTVGETYRVTNHIVTADGREEDRSMFIKIVQK